jgi:hypothetical protein
VSQVLPGPSALNARLVRSFIRVVIFAVLLIAAAEAFPATGATQLPGAVKPAVPQAAS